MLLIVASAAVSAKDNLSGSPLGAVVLWVPIIALVVSIVTAIDTWMKPRDNTAFAGLRRRHHEANVY